MKFPGFVKPHTHVSHDILDLSKGAIPAEYVANNGYTSKDHFGQSGSASLYLGHNVGISGSVDDASQAAWRLVFSQGSDEMRIDHAEAGAGFGSPSTVFHIDDTGNITGRHGKRVGTTASSATPTIDTDNLDVYRITALAAAITSFTTNLTGTPVDGDELHIAITDNGTARALAWGAKFEASTVVLPTTTVISARLDVWFVWNVVTSKWRCVRVA